MEKGGELTPSGWSDHPVDGSSTGSEPGSSGLEVGRDAQGADVLDFEPVVLRARRDGWTPDRQIAFIEALANCGIVREAAERVGMSEQSAHKLRARSNAVAFRRAWDAALEIGGERLGSIAYERAVTGTVKSYYYRGKKVGEDRVYDNRLLIGLLGAAERRSARIDSRPILSNMDGWQQAIEDGFDSPPPSPNGENARVWQDSKGEWRTNYPPPHGFDGPSCGQIGQRNYGRVCDAGEIAAIMESLAQREREDMRQRDVYFARLKGVSAPTYP